MIKFTLPEISKREYFQFYIICEQTKANNNPVSFSYEIKFNETVIFKNSIIFIFNNKIKATESLIIKFLEVRDKFLSKSKPLTMDQMMTALRENMVGIIIIGAFCLIILACAC